MKKILLLIALFSVSFFAQDTRSRNPNVELPDFVIMGKDVVTIQKAKKIEPDYIPIVSEEYLKPGYSPEELELRELSDPLKEDINMLDSVDSYNGKIKVGAGRYTLPEAEFSLSAPFNYGVFEIYGAGKNQLEYVDNSERYLFNVGGNLFFNVATESAFLPGTQFKLHGNYKSSAYKFFASQVLPLEKRNYTNADIHLRMNGLLNDQFIYGIKAGDNISFLKDENFTENLLEVSGFARLNMASFFIGTNLNFQKQFLTVNNFTDIENRNVNDLHFFAARPIVGLDLSRTLKAEFGINYSQTSGKSFLSPHAAIGFIINKNLSLFGEFSPQAEFLTAGDFLADNPYYQPDNYYNIYLKKTNVINASIKYEFDKYYQIDGGIKYFTANNLPYFVDSLRTGRFYVQTVESYGLSAYLNLLFHRGPYGVFYGTVEFQNIRDTSDNVVPYYSMINASLSYGYNFTERISAGAVLNYSSKRYTDILNNNSLKPFIDLGLNFSYRFISDFTFTLQFNNLLSDDIYKWNGYKAVPLDVIAGLKFEW